MSQPWQPPTRPPGGGGNGGSVRRARERMEAGLPSEIPQQPPQQRPYETPRSNAPSPPSTRARPQMPAAMVATKNGQGPIGVAISRPTQVPQWPLAATIEGTPDLPTNQQYKPPAGRGAPPQRPPRPSHVPSMLDASRLQEHTPSFQYKPQESPESGRGRGRSQEDLMSPSDATSPLTQSSRPSTISSVGTIPDFPVPVPQQPGPGRRSANLGPPPSARRGASSYYSQASFVSPIPEESPRTQPSHGSYASSAAMPTSWGSDSPGYRYEDDDEENDRRFRNEVIEEGRESRESNLDDSDDRNLIRSASLGKRAKPSMITTKNSDRMEPTRPNPTPQQPSKLQRMGIIAGGAGAAGAGAGLVVSQMRDGQRETIWPMIGNADSPLAGGTGLIDKSSTSSDETVPQVARAVTTNEPYGMSASDPRAQEILGAYNAASSLQPGPTPSRTPSPGNGFSRLSAIRRPPKLDMDAVRDAEARGSLTSLPDLIRRATRLAAMMDRGKRPGSRLNDLNDFPSDSDFEKSKDMSLSPDEKRKSGLSGMLAAFPPPGLATPTPDNSLARPISSWPQTYDPSSAGLDPKSPRTKKKRRCCGLPCWGLFIVLLILLIIIAAAVVVPLELLVIHKPKSSTTAPSVLQQCQANPETACQNGGSSVLSVNACACICINGFTGSTCTVANETGCTTTTISGSSYTNVTLGDSITRLIAESQTNFSIPLFESVILARFNSANLSCASENALVTFDGESQRQGMANDVVIPPDMVSAAASSATTAANVKRGGNTKSDSSSTTSSSRAVSTSNGIVYDPNSPSTATTPSTTVPTGGITAPTTATTATTSQTAVPTALFLVTEEVLDFARVAVLFILQQENLDNAVTAQGALQHFFSLESFENMAAVNVSLGNGNNANLLAFSLNLGNGSVGAPNATAMATKRSLTGRSGLLWETPL